MKEYQQFDKVLAEIHSRPEFEGRVVKPIMEKFEGFTLKLSYGWMMDENDSYPNEVAWITPNDSRFPEEFPNWIAGGDIKILDDY